MTPAQHLVCSHCGGQNPALLRRCGSCSAPLDKSALPGARTQSAAAPAAEPFQQLVRPAPRPSFESEPLPPRVGPGGRTAERFQPAARVAPDVGDRPPLPTGERLRPSSDTALRAPASLPPTVPPPSRAWLGWVGVAGLVGVSMLIGSLVWHPPVIPPKVTEPSAALQAARASLALIELVPPEILPAGEGRKTGTGVLISSDGLLLTSYDLWSASRANPARSLTVTLADGSVHAVSRCAATSSESGVAVLQIAKRASVGLPLATRSRLKVHEEVVLMGAVPGASGKPSYPFQSGHLLGTSDQELSQALRYPLLLTHNALVSAAPVLLLSGELLGMLQLPPSQVRSGYVVPLRELMPLLLRARQPDAPPCS